jgi:hypothetical protein
MELDHIYLLVSSKKVAEKAVIDLGLDETYKRTHPGQGTSNICCCFDNLFIEFLWVENRAEAENGTASKLRFNERADEGACPFGISWRGAPAEPAPEMWQYRPSYLPNGVSIAVVEESLTEKLPLVFQSPGLCAPSQWPEDKRKSLQHKRGFGKISDVTLSVPKELAETNVLKWLSNNDVIKTRTIHSKTYAMSIEVANLHRNVVSRIVLPELSIQTIH